MISIEDISEPQRVMLELAAIDTHDPRGALRRVLKLDSEALNVERVNVWILSAPPLAITCVEGYLASEDGYESGQVLLARDYPAYFRALQEETIIAAADAGTDPRTSEFREGYLDQLGITSMMDVPVWVGGELAGIVCHEHVGSPRQWTERECELALAVAQAVAAVLQAEQAQCAEHTRRRATFLSDASAVLTESLDIDEIPTRLAHLAVPMLGDWCVIDVREHGRIRRIAAAHIDAGGAELLTRNRGQALDSPQSDASRDLRDLSVHTCRSPTEHAIVTGQTLLVQDPTAEQLRTMCCDEEDARSLRSAGARFLLAVPLVVRSEVFGAVGFGAAEPRLDVDQDVELAQELARRAALAINNAQLYRELQLAVTARDEFLSVASHELFTPISALQLAVQALGEDPERAQRMAERQVKRIARLIDELLDVARLRTGRFSLSLEPVDLTLVVREVVEDFRDDLERAGCTITVAAVPSVVGRWERSKLERIVTNLLSNAAKFGAGKPIELSVAVTDDTACLVARDYGIGIAPDQLSHVFDAYQRAVPARQYGGLGLGLSIVRECVDALGGRVRVESEPNAGTTFTIELPIAGPAEATHEP